MAFIKHGSRLVRVPKCRLVLVHPDTEARNRKLSNAQDNIILKENSDHQRHESLNNTAEQNPSDKDSSFELKINATCRFLMIKNILHKNQKSKVNKQVMLM